MDGRRLAYTCLLEGEPSWQRHSAESALQMLNAWQEGAIAGAKEPTRSQRPGGAGHTRALQGPNPLGAKGVDCFVPCRWGCCKGCKAAKPAAAEAVLSQNPLND